MSAAETTISFRADAEKIDTLGSLAAARDRPRSYLINEAITNYIELHAYQDALIRKGLEEMRKGRVVSHEEVVKRLKQTGRGRRLSSRLSGNDRMDRAGAPGNWTTPTITSHSQTAKKLPPGSQPRSSPPFNSSPLSPWPADQDGFQIPASW